MANSPKEIQLRELKDTIAELNKLIKTLQTTLDAANKREEVPAQERDNLKEEVNPLKKKLFGSSSEKRSADVPGQLNLFNEAEAEQDFFAAEAEEMDEPFRHRPKRPVDEKQTWNALRVSLLKRYTLIFQKKKKSAVNTEPCWN